MTWVSWTYLAVYTGAMGLLVESGPHLLRRLLQFLSVLLSKPRMGKGILRIYAGYLSHS
jgi:hypothetical protein